MDPISALSVACNVLQLVEQAIKAANLCKELYEQGSLDENNRIEEFADYLTAANADLEIVFKKHATTSAIRTTKLQKIYNEATKTATVLKLELNKLKLSKKQGIRQLGSAFTMSLRTMVKKGTIGRLREQLEAQETALQSSLVKELYIKAGQDNLTRRKEFRYLSKGQRNNIAKVLDRLQLASGDIIKAIEGSETALSAHLDSQDLQLERSFQMLSVNLPSTIKKSEGNIVKRLAAQDLVLEDAAHERHAQSILLQEQKHDALRVRLLDSLAFPEMNERRNMIVGRVTDFGDTYLWIFYPPPRTDDYQQHEFANWLRDEKDIFWISGKPGSGKSSLMEYIYQNLQVGQILDTDDNLPGKIRNTNDTSVPASLKSCLTRSGSRAQDWTVFELQSWFSYLATHSQYNYCILIDGLDEVAGEIREHLLDCVRYIASSSRRIKVCCSSRPEYPFQNAIRQYPSIRLQDFNHGDIKLHCDKRLTTTRAAPYASEICSRAEGVFLWAYLVTEDLRTAASQGDSLEDLEWRLKECPTEMNKLFTFMLERQDRFYAKHPKPYLPLILASHDPHEDPTLLELLLASQDETKLTTSYSKIRDASHLASWDGLAIDLEANVVARCANLVECYVPVDGGARFSFPGSFPHQQISTAHDTAVRFIHRSARDFLVESEGGVAFLQSCNISVQDALRRLTLASAIAFLLNTEETFFWRPLRYASSIQADCWTSLETSAVDTVFAEAQVRNPWEWPSLASEACCEGRSWHHTYLEPLCPDISLLDNFTYELTAQFSMVAYIEAKLAGLDSGSASLVAGYSTVCAILSPWVTSGASRREFIGRLEHYLSWTESLTLVHNLHRHVCSHFLVSGCLWQHVQLALTHLYCSGDDKEATRALAGFLQGLSRKEVQSSYVEGWLIYSATDEMPLPVICLSPDEAAGCVKDFQVYDVFVIHLATQDPAEWGLNALSFCSLSPAGLERFFEVGSTVNEALRKLVLAADETSSMFTMNSAILEFDECLAAILNQYLDELTPVEIARILFLHRNRPRLGFSKGKFCKVVNNKDHASSKTMSEEETDCYSSRIDPEDDSELGNSIRRLLSKWGQQNPTSIQDYQLEVSDSDEGKRYDAHYGDLGQYGVSTDEADGEDVDEEDHSPCSQTAGEDNDHSATRDTEFILRP